MKRFNFFSWFFGIIGIIAGVLGIFLSFQKMDAAPVLAETPDAAMRQAEQLLDALCAGDYAGVEERLHGQILLGLDRPASDTAGIMIREAFEDSLSYEFAGACYATDNGLARDVVFTYLDLDSVTEGLGQRSRTLLEQRIAEAEDMSEIYDEKNEYREDFVMAALHDAVKAALEEDAKMTTVRIALNLVYEDGQWWVLPERPLLDVISGGILN
jgi:hypothetical protein